LIRWISVTAAPQRFAALYRALIERKFRELGG
jgi:hypothetical protein